MTALRLHGLGASGVAPGVFASAPALKRLDLSANNLRRVDFAVPGLVELNLTNNDLEELGGLASFPNLEVLNIDGNAALPV